MNLKLHYFSILRISILLKVISKANFYQPLMSILEITSSQINYMHRKNLTSLTPSQRIELASLIKKYTKKPGVLHQHMEWHMANGSGGTTGPGSGERFLAFHRNYIGKLEDWIKTQVS